MRYDSPSPLISHAVGGHVDIVLRLCDSSVFQVEHVWIAWFSDVAVAGGWFWDMNVPEGAAMPCCLDLAELLLYPMLVTLPLAHPV
jgi:hypothetical protein